MDVVFGADGRTGGETARALLACGHKVRVVLRDGRRAGEWDAAGAEIATADIMDGVSVAAALDGAETAFLLNPTPVVGDPFAHAEAVGAALADGLRRAGTPKAVVLSSIGAGHRKGTGVVATLNQIERLLSGATPALAFLRCGYFAETWAEVADAARHEGILPSFIALDQKIPTVSTADIGRVAADLLTEGWQGTRIVELSGPSDASAKDVAASFARVLGRPVAPLFVAPGERAGHLAEAGMDAPAIAAFLGMYEGIADCLLTRDPRQEQRRGTVTLNDAVARILSSNKVA